jgi:Cu(I)/Ag(I) efflux system membrane fusion protein
MKTFIFVPFAAIIFIACNNSPKTNNKGTPKVDSTAVNKPADKEVYTCPMDTDYHSDKPGKCPKCGMELEKTSK